MNNANIAVSKFCKSIVLSKSSEVRIEPLVITFRLYAYITLPGFPTSPLPSHPALYHLTRAHPTLEPSMT